MLNQFRWGFDPIERSSAVSHWAIPLVVEWLSGSTFFIALEASLKFGLLGGVGYAVAGLSAFASLAAVGKRVQSVAQDSTLLGCLAHKLPPAGLFLPILMIILYHGGILFLQEEAGRQFMDAWLPVSMAGWELIFFALSVLLFSFPKLVPSHLFSMIQLILLFAVALLLPIDLFLRIGINNVYLGVRLYQPYTLVTNNPDVVTFLVASILILSGHLLLSHTFWSLLQSSKNKKIAPTFLLAGAVGLTLSFSFSTLVFSVIYTGEVNSLPELLDNLFRQFDSRLLSYIIFLSLFVSLVFSFVGELNIIFSVLFSILEHKLPAGPSTRASWVVTIFIALATELYALSVHIYILNILLLVGCISASTLIPFMTVILTKKRWSVFIPFSALGGAVGGILTGLKWDYVFAAPVSFALAGVLSLLAISWTYLVREARS
ncbi:hypothetical protein CEB3_c16770 [Peptococcaceae bacterium CEB3]|nr:hypothetical protein CEB3_c16770 [Peptococcaceae bacterium CEB3]